MQCVLPRESIYKQSKEDEKVVGWGISTNKLDAKSWEYENPKKSTKQDSWLSRNRTHEQKSKTPKSNLVNSSNKYPDEHKNPFFWIGWKTEEHTYQKWIFNLHLVEVDLIKRSRSQTKTEDQNKSIRGISIMISFFVEMLFLGSFYEGLWFTSFRVYQGKFLDPNNKREERFGYGWYRMEIFLKENKNKYFFSERKEEEFFSSQNKAKTCEWQLQGRKYTHNRFVFYFILFLIMFFVRKRFCYSLIINQLT